MMRRTIVTVNGATAENGDITGMDVIVVSNAPFKIPMHEKANPIMASREYLRARTKLIKSNSWEASKTNNQQVLGREIRNIIAEGTVTPGGAYRRFYWYYSNGDLFFGKHHNLH